MNDIVSQQKQQLQELLGKAQNVGVLLSREQSMDAVAAALSIALILQDSGKSSQIVSEKEPIVEFSSLVGIDQIRKSFAGSTKMLTVSFPYTEGSIDKVSYNIEGDRLNVNLFAEANGIAFTEKDVRYVYQGSTPNLVITVGVSNITELQSVVDSSTASIIAIDTKENSQFGALSLSSSAYSSFSEIVAKLAQELSLQIEFDVAQNLLDGIMSATSNFTSSKTSPLAFEMAGFLMQKGAVRRAQKPEGRVTDTSLQMLGNKPQNSQNQFNTQKIQQPFNMQNFPKQNPFKNEEFLDQQSEQVQKPFQNNQEEEVVRDFDQGNQKGRDRLQEVQSQLRNIPSPQVPEEKEEAPQVPPEDQAPSDWFTPKVFKSNKN